jgi:hypothetical protein
LKIDSVLARMASISRLIESSRLTIPEVRL